jgi:two-component system, chemotaxis family, protein-glutamate methylesterase/glutaminase
MSAIRVLVVEDSPLMRNFLSTAIAAADGFEVVGAAHNAADAWEKLNSLSPDVVTLDVELPDMSGISVLERIMQGNAPSVVMVSGLTQSGAQTTLRALQLGAVDYIGKPESGRGADQAWIDELIAKLRRAAAVRPVRVAYRPPTTKPQEPERVVQRSASRYRERVIVVGAGSGAADTANRLIAQLPRDCPPVVVALQLSAYLIQALLPMLVRRVSVEVKVVNKEELLSPGTVYFGAGDRHLGLVKVGAERYVRPQPGAPVRGWRPSIDLLFESAATQFGSETTGILLDAAGEDGEAGLRALQAVNARALRQARNMRMPYDRGVESLSRRDRPADISELSTERIIDTIFGLAQIK